MDRLSKRDLEVGKRVTVSRAISEADVAAFADLSLDTNPIHFEDAYAAKTIFGKRIAHGMLSAALISGALTKLMGDSNVLLGLELEFRQPVYIGDQINCQLTIVAIDHRNVSRIEVEITVNGNKPVITGWAKCMRTAPVAVMPKADRNETELKSP